MNNFLAMLELCAFYIEYKKVKFKAIGFRGRINVKYFMQTQILRFCKDTAELSSRPFLKITSKSTLFLPAFLHFYIFYQYCRLNFQHVR